MFQRYESYSKWSIHMCFRIGLQSQVVWDLVWDLPWHLYCFRMITIFFINFINKNTTVQLSILRVTTQLYYMTKYDF